MLTWSLKSSTQALPRGPSPQLLWREEGKRLPSPKTDPHNPRNSDTPGKWEGKLTVITRPNSGNKNIHLRHKDKKKVTSLLHPVFCSTALKCKALTNRSSPPLHGAEKQICEKPVSIHLIPLFKCTKMEVQKQHGCHTRPSMHINLQVLFISYYRSILILHIAFQEDQLVSLVFFNPSPSLGNEAAVQAVLSLLWVSPSSSLFSLCKHFHCHQLSWKKKKKKKRLGEAASLRTGWRDPALITTPLQKKMRLAAWPATTFLTPCTGRRPSPWNQGGG